MIDLSLIKGVSVDPAARLARAAAGATWGEFDLATQRYGLATTGGTVSPKGAGLAWNRVLPADRLSAPPRC